MPKILSSAAQRELLEERLAYWTPERMAGAEPAEFIIGPPPSRPRPAPRPPGKFSTELVPDPADATYCRVGKLYFTLDGKRQFGSACAINKRGILTAAHLMYNPTSGKYATDGLYMPAYDEGGSEKYGSFPLYEVPVIPEERKTSYSTPQWDYAFWQTAKGGPDQNSELGEITGTFTLIVNMRKKQAEWETVGYPGPPPDEFNGAKMWRCTGKLTADAVGYIAKEGNLTKGSSGGPWRVPGKEFVNGVQSANSPKDPGQNFSPYFDKAVEMLYEKAFGS